MAGSASQADRTGPEGVPLLRKRAHGCSRSSYAFILKAAAVNNPEPEKLKLSSARQGNARIRPGPCQMPLLWMLPVMGNLKTALFLNADAIQCRHDIVLLDESRRMTGIESP